MRKSLKNWLRSLEYREEATIAGLSLLSAVSALCTLIMCFFNMNKAVLLLLVSLILIGLLLYYRMHHRMHIRASITTLRVAHAIRRKRKRH